MKRLLPLSLVAGLLAGCGSAPTSLATSALIAAPSVMQAATPAADPVVAGAPSAAAADPDAHYQTNPGELRAFQAAQAAPNAINVVTYNTGVGDKSHAKQDQYADLPMFQRVINGAADAPIICSQEVGPALASRLGEEQEKHHNFDVFWMTTTPTRQGNLIVVPKRFHVVAHEAEHYSGRLAQVWDNIFHHQKGVKPNWNQTQEHRGYMWVEVKDTQTDKTTTILCTHISYWDPMRQRQVPQFAKAIAQAEAHGNVIACGDFNTASLDTNWHKDAQVEKFWNVLKPLGLTDMGPTGLDGVSDPASNQNIDHVLAKGFTSLHTHMYRGTEISLPGFPTSRSLSDHDPEEDVIQYAN